MLDAVGHIYMKIKEEIKPNLFTDDMIIYTENPVESTVKLELIGEFSKNAASSPQKATVFLCTSNVQLETEVF